MRKNIGTLDRFIRLMIAVALIGLAVWRDSWLLYLAGAFVLFEAAFSWCILFQLLGKNTCSKK